MELVQVEDALDLKDCFTDLAKSNVGRNTLKEDVCSASDCIVANGWLGVSSGSMTVMEIIEEINLIL